MLFIIDSQSMPYLAFVLSAKPNACNQKGHKDPENLAPGKANF